MLAQSPDGTRLGKNKVNPLLISRDEGVAFCLYHHYLMINIFSPSDNLGEDVIDFSPLCSEAACIKKEITQLFSSPEPLGKAQV